MLPATHAHPKMAVRYSRLSHNLLAIHICSALHSLAGNMIYWGGKMEGLNALIDAMKQMPQLTSLK